MEKEERNINGTLYYVNPLDWMCLSVGNKFPCEDCECFGGREGNNILCTENWGCPPNPGERIMDETIEINGMKFERVRLLPNFQGVYDSDPCPECHLDIHWVDYGGQCLCGQVDCARTNRKDPHVWQIVGGIENLKPKNQ